MSDLYLHYLYCIVQTLDKLCKKMSFNIPVFYIFFKTLPPQGGGGGIFLLNTEYVLPLFSSLGKRLRSSLPLWTEIMMASCPLRNSWGKSQPLRGSSRAWTRYLLHHRFILSKLSLYVLSFPAIPHQT